MCVFAYRQTEADIIIAFGMQLTGCVFSGLRKADSKEIVLGRVRGDGRVTVPLSVFNNFGELKVDGKNIELLEEKENES